MDLHRDLSGDRRSTVLRLRQTTQPAGAQAEHGEKEPLVKRSLNRSSLSASMTPGASQWLLWEQISNVARFRQEPGPTTIKLVRGKRNEAKVMKRQVLDERSAARLREVSKAFELDSDRPLIPQHPLNTSKRLPGHGRRPVAAVLGALTASRSMLFPKLQVTVKAPTNHPNPIDYQPDKLRFAGELLRSIPRSDWVATVDQKLGADPNLLLGLELVAVQTDAKRFKGWTTRDVATKFDGHYYLPLLSLPYVNKSYGPIFAEQLGRAKAKMLYRYALQPLTPNAQNFALQLEEDASGRPTGRLHIHDLTDWFPVRSLFELIADKSFVETEIKNGRILKTNQFFRIKNINPLWTWPTLQKHLLESGVTREESAAWREIHDAAYVDELQTALGISFKQRRGESRLAAIHRVVGSPEGKRAFVAYHTKGQR
jgi:hypothetical protein